LIKKTSMESIKYVHGYSEREGLRLKDQAATLDDIIHNDSIFPKDSLVLEAGCGVGAQTKIIATKNPDSNFISVDLSEDSIIEAKRMIKSLDINNVELKQADIYNLPFKGETFDSVIICFVLEHLHNPIQALNELKRVLKKGGTIVAVEGDHGSTFFYPDSKYAYSAINCQIQLQKQSGGNSNIGRELYPLFKSIELADISVLPRMVYVDASKPQLVEGFIKNTFTAMIEGVGEKAIQQGIVDRLTFEKGLKDLYRTAESDGVFSYTFFKGFGTKK
jgi:ubiquinone/menaquinone biosynthesis C-methylase UbiE